MRVCVALLLLGGCTAPHRTYESDAAADSAPDADDSEPMFWRRPTAIVTDGSMVAWSRSEAACPLEGAQDCAPAEPTVLIAPLSTGVPRVLVETRGAVLIVGSPDELFYVNPDAPDAYITRVRPNEPGAVPTPLSVPHPYGIRDLAVDATYVYWFEIGINGDPGRTRRASRAGDGSDVTTISGARGSVIFGGYFWTSGCTNVGCTVQRTPVSGGTAEEVSTAGSIVGADASLLYVVEPMDPSGYYRRLMSMTADGTTEILTDWLYQPYSPYASTFVVASGALYWLGSTGEMHTVPASGGTPTVIPGVTVFEGQPFAVAASSVLYDFDGSGYTAVAL
jgi:hypothetical protein